MKNDRKDSQIRLALRTDTSAVPRLNQEILQKIKSQENQACISNPGFFVRFRQRLTHLVPVPVLILIFIVTFSLTAYAAIRFLTASEAAREISFDAMGQAFEDEDALPSAGWTLKQREALNALSLPDEILYITKDRILTGHESAEANGFVMQAYDYTGTLLVEKAFAYH